LTVAETKPTSPSAITPELFDGLPNSVIQSISAAAVQRSIPVWRETAGEVTRGQIFRDGEPRNSLSVLLEGQAKVSWVDANGNEVILWLTSPGQFIGSLNLAPGTYSSTAVALEPCKVLTWSLAAFEAILDRFPQVTRNVEQIIARQTADLSNRICEISTMPLWHHLARTLVCLTEQTGRRVNGHFEIDITQEVLGQLISTTLYTVNHQLSWWERQGLVGRRRGVVVINDIVALKKLCGIIPVISW
jgi:CRP/FNR family transcriptional regulator